MGRHPFQVGMPLPEPVHKDQFQSCCWAGEEGIPPQAFSSFPSCPIWGLSPKAHLLLQVGEEVTWRRHLPAYVSAFIIGGGGPQIIYLPYFQIAKNNAF